MSAPLYVSVSRVDEFKKVSTIEWATEERLISSIRDREPLGWQAQYGSALHACIETGNTEWTSREGQTYRWSRAIVDACRKGWPFPCVFERRCQKDYPIDGRTVTVSGRNDAAHGVVIVEGKTKFGHVDVQDYVDSLQWRFYLDMVPWARCVEYRIHQVGGMYSDKNTGQLRIAKTGVRLEDIHAFRMWRQAGLENDIQTWLSRFVAWADKKGLAGYLKPWDQRAA